MIHIFCLRTLLFYGFSFYGMDERLPINEFTLPFVEETPVCLNAVHEIAFLVNEGGNLPLYRNQERQSQSQPVELDSINKIKNSNLKQNQSTIDCFIQQNVHIPFGTIPFKPLIYCGLGYPALLTVMLDNHFKYYNSFDESQKSDIKLYKVNNIMNMYCIINMLNKLSSFYINNAVGEMNNHYVNKILMPQNITNHTYQKGENTVISGIEKERLTEYSKIINRLVVYQNSHLIHAYLPLQEKVADSLLQVLLQMYIFWKDDSSPNMIEPLSESIKRFLDVADPKKSLVNCRAMYDSFNELVKEMEIYIKKVHCDNNELSKRKNDRKSSIVKFLYVLNQYVNELIAIPITNTKSNRTLTSNSSQGQRRRVIDKNSFYAKNLTVITRAKNIGLTILAIALLYRIAFHKGNNRKWLN